MTSFSHYLPAFEVSRRKSVTERDKMKVWGNLMYFISYLTDILTVTNFLHHPPNF